MTLLADTRKLLVDYIMDVKSISRNGVSLTYLNKEVHITKYSRMGLHGYEVELDGGSMVVDHDCIFLEGAVDTALRYFRLKPGG